MSSCSCSWRRRDDVQGIKRGVVEMADAVVVHKAEEERLAACRTTAGAYAGLHVLPQPPSGSDTEVMLVSSLTGDGHDALWDHIQQLTEPGRILVGGIPTHATTARCLHRHARQLLIESHMHHKSEAWKRIEKAVLQAKQAFAGAQLGSPSLNRDCPCLHQRCRRLGMDAGFCGRARAKPRGQSLFSIETLQGRMVHARNMGCGCKNWHPTSDGYKKNRRLQFCKT